MDKGAHKIAAARLRAALDGGELEQAVLVVTRLGKQAPRHWTVTCTLAAVTTGAVGQVHLRRFAEVRVAINEKVCGSAFELGGLQKLTLGCQFGPASAHQAAATPGTQLEDRTALDGHQFPSPGAPIVIQDSARRRTE